MTAVALANAVSRPQLLAKVVSRPTLWAWQYEIHGDVRHNGNRTAAHDCRRIDPLTHSVEGRLIENRH